MYSLKVPNINVLSSNQNKMSLLSHDKLIEVEKRRPVTTNGYSLLDVKEKAVHLKGIMVNDTYNPEITYSLYGDFLKKPSHTFKDYKEEEKRIAKIKQENTKKIEVNSFNSHVFPLDGNYFKTYHDDYKSELSKTQNQFYSNKKIKDQIKHKSNKTNFANTDRLITDSSFNGECRKTFKNFYKESDIFNTDKECNGINLSENKTSEKYTIPNLKNISKPFTVSTKSGSEWIALNSHPNLLNYASEKFHPLNPGIKNISKTKNEIVSANKFNPNFRQKMLCEYIDATRVGCPNPGLKFRQVYTSNRFLFNKEKNICTTMLDNHKQYRSLIKPPFKK